MTGTGWIKLFRSLKEWEWYNDKNATRLLIHLLISVNYEDKPWKGIVVKAGSIVLSWDSLSNDVNLTISESRTAMRKLISSKEVIKTSTSKYQIVTLVKWDKLQLNDTDVSKQIASDLTDESQANRKQIATTKEYKKYKKYKNKENYILVLDNILLSEIDISDVPEKLKFYFKTAKSFQELFIKNLKEKKSPTTHQDKAKFKSYTDPVRLMFDTDKIEREQLLKVYNFLNSPNSERGDFSWKVNILSTKKLREKFQQLSAKANTNTTTNKPQQNFSKNRRKK